MQTENTTTQLPPTCFMLVLFFVKKPNGQLYSSSEIEAKENRKQFNSYDWTYTREKKRVTDHQVGLNKLLRFAVKQKDNIYGGYIVNKAADKKIYTFGRNAEPRICAFAEFYYDKKTQNRHCVAVHTTKIIDAPVKQQPMPLYSNINSPVKNTFKSQIEQLRERIGTTQTIQKHL